MLHLQHAARVQFRLVRRVHLRRVATVPSESMDMDQVLLVASSSLVSAAVCSSLQAQMPPGRHGRAATATCAARPQGQMPPGLHCRAAMAAGPKRHQRCRARGERGGSAASTPEPLPIDRHSRAKTEAAAPRRHQHRRAGRSSRRRRRLEAKLVGAALIFCHVRLKGKI